MRKLLATTAFALAFLSSNAFAETPSDKSQAIAGVEAGDMAAINVKCGDTCSQEQLDAIAAVMEKYADNPETLNKITDKFAAKNPGQVTALLDAFSAKVGATAAGGAPGATRSFTVSNRNFTITVTPGGGGATFSSPS